MKGGRMSNALDAIPKGGMIVTIEMIILSGGFMKRGKFLQVWLAKYQE